MKCYRLFLCAALAAVLLCAPSIAAPAAAVPVSPERLLPGSVGEAAPGAVGRIYLDPAEEEVPPVEGGAPAVLRDLPANRVQLIPFTSGDIDRIAFETMPAKYGDFIAADAAEIDAIVDYLNAIETIPYDPALPTGLGLSLPVCFPDESTLQVSLYASDIYVNSEHYSFADPKWYTGLEALLDSIVVSQCENSGLLSLTGTVWSVQPSTLGEDCYLYTVNTPAGVKTVETTAAGSHVVLMAQEAGWPMEHGESVTVYCGAEDNPIRAEILLVTG